ncbi:MAG TPA: hypothetical protein VGC80_07145, partial [Acetobacteraceae bacterium]
MRPPLRAIALLLGLCWMLAGAAVGAFELPGLSGDAQNYANSLTSRAPAGGRPQARRAAEQQAAA